MNIVITGAAQGLGLEFVRHYLAQGHNVWACYRSSAGGLQEIASDKLRTVQWDVSEAKAEAFVSGDFPGNIDILINNAGIYGPKKDAGQSLDSVTDDAMLATFDINCVGPLRVVQALYSRVVAAKGRIANVSSKMGSSDDNTSGGCYAYRASKAALVIVSKSMAVDLEPQGVKVITLHPGWVRTNMTSHSGLIDTETSVKGMTTVIDSIEQYPIGAFVAFDGKLIPY
ncbi:SDR family oxidoreductase [Pseudomonadota bacterium]